MKHRFTRIAAVAAFLAVSALVFAADNEIMTTMDAGGWKLMVHLRAVPKEYRDMVKATHHIAITVTDDNGAHVSDSRVTFQFFAGGKVVYEGEAMYMGGGHGGHGTGHNGADFTLPGPGEYTLAITVERGKTVKKASGKINAP